MTTQIFKLFPPRNSQSLKTQVIKHLLAGPIRGGGGFLTYYLILTTSPQAGIIALIVHMKKQVLWHTKSLPKVIQGCQSQESSIQTCDVLLSIFVTLDPSEMSQLIPSRKTQFLLCPIGVIALSLETFPVIYHRSWYNNHPAFRVWAARY